MKNSNKTPTHYFHQLQSKLDTYKNRCSNLNAYLHLTDLETTKLLWSNKSAQLFLEKIEQSSTANHNLSLQLSKSYNSNDLRQLSLKYCTPWKTTPPKSSDLMEKSYLLNKDQTANIYIFERIVPFSQHPNQKANAILGFSIQLNIDLKSLSPLEALIKENAQLKNQIEITQLTPKEKEILCFIAQGYSTVEIAATLDKSKNTIETHRKRILSKLNCKNMAELTHFAVKSGLY